MLAIDSTRRGARRIRTSLWPLLAAVISTGAGAATMTVDSTADAIVDDAQCTLREAIALVNTGSTTANGCAISGTGAIVIGFATALAEAATTGGNGSGQPQTQQSPTIALDPSLGPLQIDAPLTIDGKIELNRDTDGDGDNDAINVAIDAQGSSGNQGGTSQGSGGQQATGQPNRAFRITAQTTLKNLAIINGYVIGDGGLLWVDIPTPANANAPALTINSVVLNRGTAEGGRGGAIYVANGSLSIANSIVNNNIAANGGAIWTTSDLKVAESVFDTNQAIDLDPETAPASDHKGGHIYLQGAHLELVRSSLQSGRANADDSHIGAGGAIFMDGGDLDITGTLLRDNEASSRGGALALRNLTDANILRSSFRSNGLLIVPFAGIQVYTARGGAIYARNSGSISLQTGTLIGNVANAQGGAIWSQNSDVKISDFELRNNVVRGISLAGEPDIDGDGGAIHFTSSNNNTLEITDTRLLGNTAGLQTSAETDTEHGAGGAILIDGGKLTITSSNLARNTALSSGGAIAVRGGVVDITESVIGGNGRNDGNIAFAHPGKGGGIHVENGSVTIRRSTIANNVASQGGGLWNGAQGTLTLTNSTISSNQATGNGGLPGDGGGLYQAPGGDATVKFTTITQNLASGAGGGVAVGGASPNGEITASGSIVADNSANADDNVASGSVTEGTWPNILFPRAGLAALQWRSGALLHPLLADSPAIDYVDQASGQPIACSLTEDQRGAPRDAQKCDVGSFEALANPASVTVTANGPEAISTTGQQDTVVLAFTVTNVSDRQVSINGFSIQSLFNADYNLLRRLLMQGDGSGQTRPFKVVIDDNGNGLLDAGENRIITPAGGSQDLQLTLSQCAGACVLSAGGNGSDGDHLDLLVVIPGNGGPITALSAQMPLYAGGMLLGLLAVLTLTGLPRRTRLIMALAIIAIGLTACSNADGPPPPYPGASSNPELAGDLRYRLMSIDASSNGNQVITDDLPVYGPALNIL